MDRQTVIERTRRWISSVVIGLHLCPFAEWVFSAGTIRYAVTDARDEEALRDDLGGELKALTCVAVPDDDCVAVVPDDDCAEVVDDCDVLVVPSDPSPLLSWRARTLLRSVTDPVLEAWCVRATR